jgi:hypothetical protein
VILLQANVTTQWTLSTFCIYQTPTIQVNAEGVPDVFPFGGAQEFHFTVNVTNNDSPNCTAAAFAIAGGHDRGATRSCSSHPSHSRTR